MWAYAVYPAESDEWAEVVYAQTPEEAKSLSDAAGEYELDELVARREPLLDSRGPHPTPADLLKAGWETPCRACEYRIRGWSDPYQINAEGNVWCEACPIDESKEISENAKQENDPLTM